MKQTIQAQEKELKRIFSDDYLFRIPSYQRPYAWTNDQAGELLDDLLIALGDDEAEDLDEIAPYFLGSIVLIKDPLRPEADVVDGQQRLTTLTILVSVLRDLSADPGAQAALHRYICEAGNKFEGTKDRFRLTLRDRDNTFFRSLVQEQGALPSLVDETGKLSDSQACIRANALLFKRRLEEMSPNGRDQLAMFLAQRCFLVVVSASDRDAAYRIFSVMNSRGLDLSPTDILKAEIIGALPSADQETYTDTWEEIEEEIGRDGFVDLFGHVRMIFMKAKARQSLTQDFRSSITNTIQPRAFIDTVLTPLSSAYETVVNADYEAASMADKVNAYLTHLNRLDNTDWIPPAISYVSRHGKDSGRLLTFIRDLERLAYAMFIFRSNVNDRINRYAEVLRAIEGGADLAADSSPLQLTNDEKGLVLSTLDGPIYPLLRVRMPLLLRLDDLLADGGAVYDHRIISIEHVLPQTPAAGSVWLDWFPTEESREHWVHRLANLVLLTHQKNSQAQNYDFDRKKNEYFQRRNVSTFALTSQVLGMSTWTPEILEARQRQLIDRLSAEWRLE